jgi:hypothetical protein
MNKFTQALFDLAERAGKWGIPGVFLILMRSVIDLIRHFGWDALESCLETWGVGLIVIGVLASTKKLKDMTVTNAAEAKIDRAVIVANTTPGGAAVVPQSSEPAVNREIEKQLRVSNGAPIVGKP